MKDKIIGLANGCFDYLHEGHIKFLLYASEFCSELYVALNSDESVKMLKGDNRPYYIYEKRKQDLINLNIIKDIYKFDNEYDLEDIIFNNKVDFIFKGSDTAYDKQYKNITGKNMVKAVVYIDHGIIDIHSRDIIKSLS